MIIGYARTALAFLEAAGLLTKILIAAGLIGSAAIAYGVWHHRIYESGVADAVAGIAREDSRFIDRAIKARDTWQACHDQHRGWDQTTGRCL
jgi:hypothetical protein